MKEIATIRFTDEDSGDQAIVVVRAGKRVVALSFSLEDNGDIEVFMSGEAYLSLRQALEEAIHVASQEEVG